MRKIIPILLISAGILKAAPSENAIELVKSMKLVDVYSTKYGSYYGSYDETVSPDEIIEALTSGSTVSGLERRLAEHIEKSLKEKEIKEALEFYNSDTGINLTKAIYHNGENYSVLDQIAQVWGAVRTHEVREFLLLRMSGGKEAVPYVRNLRLIVSACQQYMLEKGKDQAGYSDVVGTYIKEIQPIKGEGYDDIVVSRGKGTISVKDEDGKVYEYSY